MKAHMWGSTFVADGKVYVGDEDGDLSCAMPRRRRKEKKVISETNLGAPIYSHAHRRQRRHLRRQQHAPLRLLRRCANAPRTDQTPTEVI